MKIIIPIIALLAIVSIGGVYAAVVFVTQSSTLQTGSSTTTVTGTALSNGGQPIYINGIYYDTGTIAGFTQTIASGTVSPSNPSGSYSVVALNLDNFYAGGYVEFNVTITNTGTAALLFQNSTGTPQYIMNCYFCNPDGSYMSPQPEGTPSINVVEPWTVAGFGTDTLATFVGQLNTGDWGVNATWCVDNSYLSGATALPVGLAPGASCTYYIYIGLGDFAPYNLPGIFYSISIPLTPSSAPLP